MICRRVLVGSVLAGALLVPGLAGCSSEPQSETSGDASLSQDEVVMAEAVARQVIADQGASVSNASAVARDGRVTDSNTGHPCTSGRELRIKLIGRFPQTVTTGHPMSTESPAPDFTVRALVVTADAQSGQACLIGVETAEDGEVAPLAGGTTISVS